MYNNALAINSLIEQAHTIVIIQADNPDADSLGSALALERLLSDLQKDALLYCGVDIPTYLRFLEGWDRVSNELPKQFDLSIIVDASSTGLLEQLQKQGELQRLTKKPCVVLDHHGTVSDPILFADEQIIDTSVASTGQLLFHMSEQLKWAIHPDAATAMMASILGDTQGLTNDLTGADTYRTMAALVECGANRPLLEERRRETGKMAQVIYRYKGQLLQRSEFSEDGTIVTLQIPQSEINEYSPLYNPSALVQFDMLQVEGVLVSIVLKEYDDGRVTGAIRANPGAPVAAQLAESLGGGGHPYASGFKVNDGRTANDIKNHCLKEVRGLIDEAV